MPASDLSNWLRFWAKPNAQIRYDNGFLYRPDDETIARIYNGSLESIENLRYKKCLVLLGEPRSGKTTCIRQEVIKLQDMGNIVEYIDLKDYNSAALILNKLQSLNFNENLLSPDTYLIFDSIDESIIPHRTLFSLIFDEIQKKVTNTENLFIRILCRTNVWTHEYKVTLSQKWNDVEVFELQALTKKDVETYVNDQGYDGNAILETIFRKNLQIFARIPITLKLLVDFLKDGEEAPVTTKELYERGIKKLCEDPQQQKKLSVEQSFAIACRVAALLLFTNHKGILRSVNASDTEEFLPVNKILGGAAEEFNGQSVVVDLNSLSIVIEHTSLFTARGDETGFFDRGFEEFLAAYYLVNNNFSKNQIFDLLVNGDDPKGRIVPQLKGVATWVSTLRKDILDTLIDLDPEIVIFSDISGLEEDTKAKLVKSLLHLYDTDFGDYNRQIYHHLKKLNYSSLAVDLRPFIIDKNKVNIARRLAIAIAEACNLQELQNEIVAIGIDDSENLYLRKYAVRAIAEVGDRETRIQLKPFLTLHVDDDTGESLKGWALRALWPDILNTKELFTDKVLTPQRNSHHIGSYDVFLDQDLSKLITAQDYPIAASWACKKIKNQEIESFKRFIDQITLKGLEYKDDPECFKAFSLLYYLREKRYIDFTSSKNAEAIKHFLQDNQNYRRKLITIILTDWVLDAHNDWVIFSGIAEPEDYDWLIDIFDLDLSDSAKKVVSQIIYRDFLGPKDTSRSIYKLSEACKKHPILFESFELIYGKDITNQINEKLQNFQRVRQESANRQKRRAAKSKKPENIDQIRPWLLLYQEKKISLYEILLTLESDRIATSLSSSKLWEDTPILDKTKLLGFLKQLLVETQPEVDKYITIKTIYGVAMAQYKVIRLVFDVEPNFFINNPDVLKKWVGFIVQYTLWVITDDPKKHSPLLSFTYNHQPHEFLRQLETVIRKHYGKVEHELGIDRIVNDVWDLSIEKKLLQVLRTNKLCIPLTEETLSILFERGSYDALDYARGILKKPFNSRPKAIVTGRALLLQKPNEGWDYLWPLFEQDKKFGKELVQSTARFFYSNDEKLNRKFNTEQLKSMFIWMESNFPTDINDDFISGILTSNEFVSRWKETILRVLQETGTREAVEALKCILNDFPGLSSRLQWNILYCEEALRQKSWASSPPTPEMILKLAGSTRSRYITSGDQLLTLLMELLSKLGNKLQKDTPSALHLWNVVKVRSAINLLKEYGASITVNNDLLKETFYFPKDEESFSDYVKQFLEAELIDRPIILNREVQIDRIRRTDIKIDAVSSVPNNPPISLIIEVKGCWNDKLMSSFEDQLIKKYLIDRKIKYGIYLIGWFKCDSWSKGDNRKGTNSRAFNLEALLEQSKESSKWGIKAEVFVLDTALK